MRFLFMQNWKMNKDFWMFNLFEIFNIATSPQDIKSTEKYILDIIFFNFEMQIYYGKRDNDE
jgi:hypothetical protein